LPDKPCISPSSNKKQVENQKRRNKLIYGELKQLFRSCMEKRLVKIAQELNVGTSTIVEFLNSKGFQVENKPTTKLTEEMEALLIKEFQKSIDIKEQADQLTIGVRPILKKEISNKPDDHSITTTFPPPPPVFKKDEPVFKKPIFKKEEPKVQEEELQEVEPVEEEKPKVGLTIKGKIELDRKGRPFKHKIEKTEEKPEPTEHKEEEQPIEAVTEIIDETPVEEPDLGQPQSDVSTEVPLDEEDDIVRMETPELRGLKILGKIDIKKKEPKKKKGKPAPEPIEQTEEPKGRPSPDAGHKPSPVSSSDFDDRKKRKRKRKKVGPSIEHEDEFVRSYSRKKKTALTEEERKATDKLVEEQIRKTMQTMSGAGKKKRQKLRRESRERHREKQELIDMEGNTDSLEVTEFITVQELANLMNVSPSDIITTCMSLNVFVSINQRLDAELIELVASEYGHEVKFISAEEEAEIDIEEEDAPEDLKPRAPIVTVMGHVDHGKTSLLDFIRHANVVKGEAGGITQHIGAYEVETNGKKITFLDTPGHEAFTAMRARGTKVTDIAIIVVAADDNVMPQTREAISHAQAAGVPMVFAINKIDKENARPEHIKQELASMNILVEDWGGDFQSQEISAKSGVGIDKLLEKVLLVAELAELKANPDRLASGTVIEASLDKGKGYVAKMLVQNGTLNVGDAMVAGEHSGKVKAMFNERGKRIKTAGPSAPVMVLGLSGAPTAGERFKIMEEESEARILAARRGQINREQATRATKRISLDEIGRRLALGTFKELNLIVKGDVDGSVEALSDSLIKLSLETVQVKVIHRAVGQIIESDVLLASASDAIIIGFQVRPSLGARKIAEREGVEIKTYSIIYEAIEEVKLAIEGMLEPTKEEKILGNIEVREVYKISKIGTVAGCFVLDGKLSRGSNVRVIRDGIVVFPVKEGGAGELGSLKRFKEDAKEVKSGMECGLTIKNFNDMKVGDIVEAFEILEIKQKYG
jgi:translation initiation factor IF-2